MKNNKPGLWLAAYDVHYPATHWPTFKAMLQFMEENPLDGFVFGGDQRDNQEISPYTRGKPRLRQAAGTYMANLRGFDERILKPIEARLPRDAAERVYILGNHDDWEQQYIDENPEWEGVQTHEALRVAERGWKVIPCGQHIRMGKLTLIHGEQLAGIGNQIPGSPAKKAVESYNSNVLFGHFHAPASHPKVMPFDKSKLMAWCSPIVGATNPLYLRNKPTAWVNGFTLIEFHGDGNFNVYPVVVTKGKFSWNRKTYGG